MGPNRTGVGMVHSQSSSSSSGIFFQGDVQSQGLGMGSFGNSNMRSNIVPVSGDVTNTSSLVTDASGGGPRLQRSASANNDSCMRLPNSPLSFTSNNISISGSSVIDGPGSGPALQPGCSQDQNLQRVGQ
nr:hypothetical protein [Tanacetum cinerariifolium]